MIRAFCIVMLFVVALHVAPVAAQQPAPAFHATPASPTPGQPFTGTLSFYWYATAMGVRTLPEVSGNTVTVQFDESCGFICPGNPGYHDFTFAMPALAAGTYVVRIVSATRTIGTFPLIVGGVAPPAPIGAPTLGVFSTIALALLLAVAGLRRRNASLRTPAGDR